MFGKTNGWVGMGVSPNGGMIGADMFVGWVKDGVATITVSMSRFLSVSSFANTSSA